MKTHLKIQTLGVLYYYKLLLPIVIALETTDQGVQEVYRGFAIYNVAPLALSRKEVSQHIRFCYWGIRNLYVFATN